MLTFICCFSRSTVEIGTKFSIFYGGTSALVVNSSHRVLGQWGVSGQVDNDTNISCGIHRQSDILKKTKMKEAVHAQKIWMPIFIACPDR